MAAVELPLIQYTNQLQRRLLEHGLKQINAKRVLDFSRSLNPPHPQHASTSQQHSTVLSLTQLRGVFDLLLIGIACSLAAFAGEMTLLCMRRRVLRASVHCQRDFV